MGVSPMLTLGLSRLLIITDVPGSGGPAPERRPLSCGENCSLAGAARGVGREEPSKAWQNQSLGMREGPTLHTRCARFLPSSRKGARLRGTRARLP
jgi:hypothetical protein